MATDSIEALWRTLTAGTGGAVAFAFKSLLGLNARAQVLETQMEAHDKQLQKGAEKIDATHTAVTRLGEVTQGLKSDVAEVKTGQKEILDRLMNMGGSK